MSSARNRLGVMAGFMPGMIAGFEEIPEMELLFLIFGLATAASLGIALLSLMLGVGLCISRRFRTIGFFVLLVPTLGALSAVSASWGLAFLCSSIPDSASSIEAWEAWEALAFCAWPVGFIVGGMLGAAAGLLIAVLLAWRRRRRTVSPQGV